MSITISNAQQALVDIIAGLNWIDIPVIKDDGKYPRIPEREAALRSPGNCVIVFPPQAGPTRSVPGKVMEIEIGMTIALEQNPSVANASTVETICTEIMTGMIARTRPTGPMNHFYADPDEPFAHFGTAMGSRLILMNFRVKIEIRNQQ